MVPGAGTAAMTTGVLRGILLGLGATAVLSVAAGLSSPIESPIASVERSSRHAPVRDRAARPPLRLVIQRAPFRMERRLPSVRFDPRQPPAGAGTTPKPAGAPRPQLVLTGIVWSEEPAALLEGLPGIEGARAVREGDLVGDLRVRKIGRERVRIVGMDTAWTLTVRDAWR